MAEYWVDPDAGSDANAGTLAAPWRTIPGMTGANAVLAGDIINVRNGTTVNVSGTPFRPPASTLTYRGYGLASNVLTLRLPGEKNPGAIRNVRVVRQAGTHEGMWTLNGVGGGVATLDVQNARAGVVIEDVQVLGETSGTINAVTLGSSAAGTQNGVTMRRFEIRGASGVGLLCYKINPTLEYFKISGTESDCWAIGATATNLYRAGSTDIARLFELVEPNVNVAGEYVGDSGDGWQTLHSAGRFESRLIVTDWLLQKTNPAKQGFLLCDALNGAFVQRFVILGSPESQATGLLTCVRGAVDIADGLVSEGCLNNAVIRLRSAETALAQLLYTGASVTLRNLQVVSPLGGVNHLFDAAEGTETLDMDGTLRVQNCTVVGDLAGGLSYGAIISLQGGNTTYGANFVLEADNNAHIGNGAFVRLPTGTANNARYRVQANAYQGASLIGSTSYATPALFEAAHSAATANTDADPRTDDRGLPFADSPLFTSGADIGSRKDIRGVKGRSYIGAYAPPLSRTQASSRPQASART